MGAVRALAITRTELIRRCRAGDGAAWEEVVQSYSRRIYNLAYRFTSRADAAEDLTQKFLFAFTDRWISMILSKVICRTG